MEIKNDIFIEKDYLTGLANRRGLYDYYKDLDKAASVHAMFIDVDNFKRVNDLYGHSVGDDLLIAIANLINKSIPGFVSRIGGDEFVALIDEAVGEEILIEVAEKAIKDANELDIRKDVVSFISLSVGIVVNQPCSKSLDDILHICDDAMYRAKFGGKGRYVICQDTDEELEKNKSIELEMKSSLENGEFKVYLQPKMNLITNEIVGAEALSRWIHPRDGLRAPDSFIPLFEKNGFISELDYYIFESTCKLKNSWKGSKIEHLCLSVNFSRVHFYERDFAEKIVAMVDKYEVAHNEIEIEITESVFVKDNAHIIDNVKAIKDKGFIVSVDDFGSGFSALNLLKDLPADIIKIDKEFLHDSGDNVRGKTVLKNVIAMCRDLKMDVVMEGIETEEQMRFISRFGCQIGQGYFYAKPLPVDEFVSFAHKYINLSEKAQIFSFDGTLKSGDGCFEANYNGDEIIYKPGIYEGSKSIFFPGGNVENNIVELPPQILSNDSYTISVWMKPEDMHLWGCAAYVKFETGFSAIVPLAWEGHSSFRIRDSREINGWYDLSGRPVKEGEWTHFCISYNARTETAISCIDGEIVHIMENVPTNRYCKRIVIGGDVFQPSFKGCICELNIYNEPMDYESLVNLYKSYVARDNFVAGKETE